MGSGSGYPAQGYPSQEFSMGQGSAHGSYHDLVPNDDDDDDDEDKTPSEEMSPVKPKKPTKRATKAKKNDAKKDTKNDSSNWTCEEEVVLCKAWCDVSENSMIGSNMQVKGF